MDLFRNATGQSDTHVGGPPPTYPNCLLSILSTLIRCCNYLLIQYDFGVQEMPTRVHHDVGGDGQGPSIEVYSCSP